MTRIEDTNTQIKKAACLLICVIPLRQQIVNLILSVKILVFKNRIHAGK